MNLRHLLVLLVLFGFALPGQSQGMDASPATATSKRLDVADTLIGILGYTRWPVEPATLRLCIAGQSTHADQFLRQGLDRPGSRPVLVRKMPAEVDIAAECDALYVGALEESAWRRILANILGRPVLTVCERSPVCSVGGMICLDIEADLRTQFEINLDSVARSTIRINPQVLRLGRRPAVASTP